MANQLGKRYTCETCGSSVLCTKSGDGEIECCDAKMELQEAAQAAFVGLRVLAENHRNPLVLSVSKDERVSFVIFKTGFALRSVP